MRALDSLEELKRQAIPEKVVSEQDRVLFAELNKEEIKLKNYLTIEGVGYNYTEEAKKINSLRREGRVESKDTTLESKQNKANKKRK
jgi:hypothetical protein